MYQTDCMKEEKTKQMIPKKIHYCWFGGNPLPKSAIKCMKTWKKYCRDYEIIKWNESNFDISSCPLYVRQAYEHKKWAFVTDYVRLKVVYDNGGIYLDTDVELVKNLDPLLVHPAYFGFESAEFVNTGHGFGAEKNSDILTALMSAYEEITFVKDNGEFNMLACPTRNTQVLLKHGLQLNNEYQVLHDGIQIFPSDYFCPFHFYTGTMNITKNTYSIHRFDSSWYSKDERLIKKQNQKEGKKDRLLHLPNRVLKKLLGEKRYNSLKELLKR